MASITLWFTLGTAGMALGTLALVYGLWLVPGSERRDYAILIAVPAIAVVAYALMALDMGAVASAVGGTVFIPRYVDWLLTTPLHILFLGLFAGASRSRLVQATGLQAAVIVFGLAAALVAGPPKWALYLAGVVAFAAVVYYAYVQFDAAARERGGATFAVYRKLRAFLVVLWLIYPVIWIVGPNAVQLMDVETTALVVAYLDIVSKVGFGLIALNGYTVTVGTETESADIAPAD
jgi:sensory rhodopsin